MMGNLFLSYLVLSFLGASCKIKFLKRPTAWRREGAYRLTVCRKVPAGGSACLCVPMDRVCTGVCVFVCCESLSPAGGALMAARRQFTATQPPTIWLPLGRYHVCVLVPMLSFLTTHSHKHSIQLIQARPCIGMCLPPTWLSPSITPIPPCPALPSAGEHLQLRSWPCLPTPSAALKLHSVLWIPTLCTAFDHLFASQNAFLQHREIL